MNGTLPEKNYYTDSYDAKWSWPSHKFQLKPDALFTTLHERFNTRNCPIQDPYAFLLDVRLCANESNNVDDFYARLAAQKAKRVLELEEIWDNVTDLMAFDEKGLPSDRIWTCKQCNNSGISDVNTPCEPMSTNDTPELHSKSFFNMIQTMSFDSMVRFFDGFVREARKERDEYYREKRARMQRGREEGKTEPRTPRPKARWRGQHRHGRATGQSCWPRIGRFDTGRRYCP
ncbi:hypothetical protein MCOR14_011191 [Pyricularia oryzae]|nr:hypothetical protein MCOR14_011191 [Pyricularia oryzae]